jgi:hypothetical protein
MFYPPSHTFNNREPYTIIDGGANGRFSIRQSTGFGLGLPSGQKRKFVTEIASARAVLSTVALTFAITGPIERKLSYPATRLSSHCPDLEPCLSDVSLSAE